MACPRATSLRPPEPPQAADPATPTAPNPAAAPRRMNFPREILLFSKIVSSVLSLAPYASQHTVEPVAEASAEKPILVVHDGSFAAYEREKEASSAG
jgi:hypothetical protein